MFVDIVSFHRGICSSGASLQSALQELSIPSKFVKFCPENSVKIDTIRFAIYFDLE